MKFFNNMTDTQLMVFCFTVAAFCLMMIVLLEVIS